MAVCHLPIFILGTSVINNEGHLFVADIPFQSHAEQNVKMCFYVVSSHEIILEWVMTELYLLVAKGNLDLTLNPFLYRYT
jgi:hypothetical protein